MAEARLPVDILRRSRRIDSRESAIKMTVGLHRLLLGGFCRSLIGAISGRIVVFVARHDSELVTKRISFRVCRRRSYLLYTRHYSARPYRDGYFCLFSMSCGMVRFARNGQSPLALNGFESE